MRTVLHVLTSGLFYLGWSVAFACALYVVVFAVGETVAPGNEPSLGATFRSPRVLFAFAAGLGFGVWTGRRLVRSARAQLGLLCVGFVMLGVAFVLAVRWFAAAHADTSGDFGGLGQFLIGSAHLAIAALGLLLVVTQLFGLSAIATAPVPRAPRR